MYVIKISVYFQANQGPKQEKRFMFNCLKGGIVKRGQVVNLVAESKVAPPVNNIHKVFTVCCTGTGMRAACGVRVLRYSQRGEVRQVGERARVHVRQRVGAQLQAREAAARLQHARRHHLHAVAGQRPAHTRGQSQAARGATLHTPHILTGPPAAAAAAPRPAPPTAGSPPAVCTQTHTLTYSAMLRES